MKRKAIEAIHRHGMLLVFPLDNKPEPRSIWQVLHPRSKMRWEWDDSGDNRVAKLWFLREELSTSRKVVYAKWFRGRATFFSRDLFAAMLSLNMRKPRFSALSREARELLSLLEENSPQSTKQLKRATDLVGRALEPTYMRALQELWDRLLIVAFGEVDEGAFPSLAIGATRLIFEELYTEARELSEVEAQVRVNETLADSPLFLKHANKVWAKLGA